MEPKLLNEEELILIQGRGKTSKRRARREITTQNNQKAAKTEERHLKT